jgi:GNAT superfamily N-acetyltransferase
VRPLDGGLAIRSALALDADVVEVVDGGAGSRLVRTPSRPDYHDGNFVLLAGPPAAPDDPDPAWAAALERALGRWPARGRAAVRWESDDPTPIRPGALPPGARASVDATLRLARWLEPDRPAPAVTCVRATDDDDWRAIVGLARASDGAPSADFVEWTYAKLRRAFTATGSAWWTAWDGDRLVGSLGLHRGADLWRFQEVETRSSYRRRGVATRLIGRALAEVPPGDPRPVVIVAEAGGAPERLYRRLGFEPVGAVHTVARP